MQLYRFDAAVGRPIEAFGSQALTQVWLARLEPGPAVHVSVLHLAAGGGVGYHEALLPQLYAVVAGSGWVRGAGAERAPLAAGQAAFWEAGEWHAAGTESGLMAIVIEIEGLNPARWLRPLE